MSAPFRLAATGDISRVILTGFMGAGKTTVGALLAERLGWDFADSDSLVEMRAGMTVGEIFRQRGEAAFRAMEAAAIHDAGGRERLVLALGGGALETTATRDSLASAPETLIVFLDGPLETLVGRCAAHADGPVRPVLADRARLEERWRARLPWYRQAHLTVDTAERPPELVVECILRRLAEGIGAEAANASGNAGRAGGKRGTRA